MYVLNGIIFVDLVTSFDSTLAALSLLADWN